VIKEQDTVVEYIDDIMTHMRDVEALRHPSDNYMAKQTDINAKMREILVDWLVEVHLKFRLRQVSAFPYAYSRRVFCSSALVRPAW
jgi:cyclin B